jgi:hypothetical protein
MSKRHRNKATVTILTVHLFVHKKKKLLALSEMRRKQHFAMTIKTAPKRINNREKRKTIKRFLFA